MVKARGNGAEAGSAGASRERPRQALRTQLLFIYGTALAIGLHIAMLSFVLSRSLPKALYVVATSAVYATLTFVLWRWVLPRFARLPLVARLACQSAVSVVCIAVLSVLAVEVSALLLGTNSLLRPYQGGPQVFTVSAENLRMAPLIFALIPIIPTAILCVVGFNLHWWRIHTLQGRERELEELAASAQLAALRAQVHPHFLFNSLNSIAQLISVDPERAEACVERLADIFRYLLARAHTDLVPLSEELAVAEAYLEIERARFGDNLRVEQRVDTQARSALLPGLILQPLVENAVKHGVSRKIGGGCVTIEASVVGGYLELAVRDSGVGIEHGNEIFSRGVGLRSVRERLLKLYGEQYAPRIVSRPGEGTSVVLRVPVVLGRA